MLYKTTIRPVLDYGDIIYDQCLKSESDAIEKFKRKAQAHSELPVMKVF